MIENGAPYMYDYRNAVISNVEPSTVHARDTVITWYWRRWLLQKAMSLFTWKLPENWDKDYFLYTLYCWGYVAIVKTDKYLVNSLYFQNLICIFAGFGSFKKKKKNKKRPARLLIKMNPMFY